MKRIFGTVLGFALTLQIALADGPPPIAAFLLGSGQLTENGMEKGTPLPDGTEIYIYSDKDSNGPDENDPQPVIGDRGGDVNFNVFKINSESLEAEPGQFFTDPMLTVIGILPDPPLYYLRVCLEDRQLVSKVVKLEPGLADYEMNEWTVLKTLCKPKVDKND